MPQCSCCLHGLGAGTMQMGGPDALRGFGKRRLQCRCWQVLSPSGTVESVGLRLPLGKPLRAAVEQNGKLQEEGASDCSVSLQHSLEATLKCCAHFLRQACECRSALEQEGLSCISIQASPNPQNISGPSARARREDSGICRDSCFGAKKIASRCT